MRTIRVILLGFITAAGMNSCAAPHRAPTGTMVAPAFALLEELPPQDLVTASQFYETAPRIQRLHVVDDDGRITETVMRSRSVADRFNADVAEAEGDRSIAYWRVDELGNIVMPAHIDLMENAISIFEPPIVIAFNELRPGELRSSESQMRVVDARNPARVREIGKATRTMQYVGDQRVRTPAGEFTAKRVEIHFLADMRMADADERTTLLIVPGIGVVAEDTLTQLKILGAFGRTDRRTVVLSDINDF